MADTNSFKSMSRSGVIKRTDTGMFIRYADIHIREGFNIRDLNDPDMAEDNASLDAHIAAGGHVPPLEVVAHPVSGVEIIEGHRRHASFGRRIAAGQTIEWIRIDPFVGNDKQQTARMLTSAQGRALKPLEIAEGYRRLEAFGMSHDDIARFVHKTRTHVAQMLLLLNAPDAVHKAVKAGEISATEAGKLAREHGHAAGAKLEELRGEAKAAGKKKITAAVTRQWTPPAKAIAPVVDALDKLHASLKPETRMQLLNEPTGDAMVMVPAIAIYGLLGQHGSIVDLREKAESKKREKAAKAGQASIPGADGA